MRLDSALRGGAKIKFNPLGVEPIQKILLCLPLQELFCIEIQSSQSSVIQLTAAPPAGCQVQAHDPTVASVRSTAGGNLMVTRKGVAAENSRNFKTLDTFVRVNNHTDYVIDYLKVLLFAHLIL